MGVPPLQAALVGTELLFLFVRQLFERHPALLAEARFVGWSCMAADEGFDAVHLQAERVRDPLAPKTASSERQNGFFFVFCHNHTSFRELSSHREATGNGFVNPHF